MLLPGKTHYRTPTGQAGGAVPGVRLPLGTLSRGAPCEGQLPEGSAGRLTIRLICGLSTFYEKTLTERLRNLVVPRRSVVKGDPSPFIILASCTHICDAVQRFSKRAHMCALKP
jgi:hypothetical protein